MRVVVGITLIALASTACSERDAALTAPVFEAAMGVVANGGNNAAVPLSGDEEVPARLTPARGTAIFHLSDDGTALDYKLNVANIENVVQAHIHVGAFGANGPVAVFLFGPAAAGGGRLNGGIAE
ncbi:MAG: CHRD domain-containing protein, partial [Gemmatimonadaceae bacterium]